MITLVAPRGKYFFSDFLTIFSGASLELEETTLTVNQLYTIVTAVKTERLEINTDDLVLLNLAYESKKNPTPEPGEGQTIDPSILLAKEDKTNKVNSFSLGSVSLYPTTSAVIEYVTSVTNNLVTNTTLTQYSLKTETDQKVDKVVLDTLATKADLTEYATKDNLSEVYSEITQGVPILVDTKLTTALTAYSTTEEFSTLLGSFEIGIGEQLANKVNLSELSNYTTTEDVDTQIDEKFNNVYGPSLAANIQGIVTQLDTKLDKPVETASEAVTTPTVETLPIYTLGNNGDYVLCTPDSWLKIGNLYVPAYTGTTIGKLD